jgi:hypothetical protein
MALADELTTALQNAAKAGATAAAKAGKDLTADINNFVLPNLVDIAVHIAAIVTKQRTGIYTPATAKALIDAQEGAIQTLVDTVATLAVLEAQIIVNAIIGALNTAVNAALGFILLA